MLAYNEQDPVSPRAQTYDYVSLELCNYRALPLHPVSNSSNLILLITKLVFVILRAVLARVVVLTSHATSVASLPMRQGLVNVPTLSYEVIRV